MKSNQKNPGKKDKKKKNQALRAKNPIEQKTTMDEQKLSEAEKLQAIPATPTDESTAGEDSDNDSQQAVTPTANANRQGVDWQGTNWVKTYFVEVMPALSLSLFFLAFIYNVAYYSVFNFNFIPYISFSESLFLIIDPLITLTFISSFILLLSLLYLIYTSLRHTSLKLLIVFMLEIIPWEKARAIIKLRLKWLHGEGTETIKATKSSLEKEIAYVVSILAASSITVIVLYNNEAAGSINYGFKFATFGLVLPFIMLLPISIFNKVTVLINPLRPSQRLTMQIQNIGARRWFGFLFLYYIYAVFVFYISGTSCANYYRRESPVTFEIKASDGQIYDNSGYTYFGQMGGRVFLPDKQTGGNVVINTESAAYTKISSKEGNSFVIVWLINNSFSKSQIEMSRSPQKTHNKNSKTINANGSPK